MMNVAGCLHCEPTPHPPHTLGACRPRLGMFLMVWLRAVSGEAEMALNEETYLFAGQDLRKQSSSIVTFRG